MTNKMTAFRLDSDKLELWLHQNQAVCTGDFIEGALLDNFVVWCKHGVAAIYERALNTWTSCYYVEFERGEGDGVWNNWYKFEEQHQKGIAS